MMIDGAAERLIQGWEPDQPVRINCLDTDHPEQKNFHAFSKQWSEIAGNIIWQPSKETAELPGFLLKENIIYSALPLEKELPPFLKTVAALEQPVLKEETRNLLDRMSLPCELTLYIALHCPHCPGMVETLIPMAAHCPHIRLHIIDGSLFPETAQKDRVMSAPCLILDRDFRWTGTVAQEEILSMILNRDPSRLSSETLKNILEAGEADWITEQMIAADAIFKGFLELLLHETWSVRLGAMVVVEALAEQAPDLGLALVPALTTIFPQKDIPIQGDILYALGEVGNPETKEWIKGCLSETAHSDLKDAAEDAMDAIDSRFIP